MGISAANFLKWCQVFGIASGGGDNPNVQVINTTTTLTASALGQTFLVTNVGPYTVTLPSPSAGVNKFINFVFQPFVPGALFTISIPGGGSLAFSTNESVTFFTNGTAWSVYSINSAEIVTNMGLAGTQSAGIIEWDSSVDSVGLAIPYASGVWGPIYPGRYEVFTQVIPGQVLTSQFLSVVKNSTEVSNTPSLQSGAVQNLASFYCNGTSDTFNISWGETGTATQIGGSVTKNFVKIKRVGIL
jgi:hypothetical protein